jgi:arylsulfatase A-like enzyme
MPARRGAGRLSLSASDAGFGLVGFALRATGAGGEVVVSGLRIHTPPATAAAAAPRPAPAARPNLVIYLIDTLRADHLGCYGYPRPTSPRIDRLAAEGVRAADGRAQSSWTKPGVASVLTGLHPSQHGAQLRAERIREEVELLSERLVAAGYETALFTTNTNVTARFGFDQGFDEFHYLSRGLGRGKREHYSSSEINREVFAWLDRRDRSRPFFLFVHTLDPHDPYRPAEEFRRALAPGVDVESACCARSNVLEALSPEAARLRARDAAALYDAEIAQNDAAFGELVDELARRGLAEPTAVLVTSDHGEEFYEHGGWKHGFTLYEEQLRVPFVLRLPGRAHAGAVVDGPVDQIDVVPTLLELAGLPAAPELPGRSLLAALSAGAAGPAERPSFARLERPGLELVAAAQGGFKLLRALGEWTPPRGRAPEELYDLARDPGEREDLIRLGTPRRRWLEGLLRVHELALGPAAPRESTPLDAETDRSLRALGYL